MPLVVLTARVGYRDRDSFDVTASTGGAGWGAPFAPSWHLLRPLLELQRLEDLSVEDWSRCVDAYTREMRASYRANRWAWDRILARRRAVLLCSCATPVRCHRRVLAEILVQLGAAYGGELRPVPAQASLPGLGR